MSLDKIKSIKSKLLTQVRQADQPEKVLKNPQLKSLYQLIPKTEPSQRAVLGQAINLLKQDLEQAIAKRQTELINDNISPIDITAPWGDNQTDPELLRVLDGSMHPINNEMEIVNNIFNSMGFETLESRQIDNDYNMFESLNFPEGHPARDDYDTFKTEEGFIPPAHTSTMQNRILKMNKRKLDIGDNIAVVSYGRVFRNEDVDATHGHTFHQYEGVFVSSDANLSQMLGTLKEFFDTYYNDDLKIRTQPAYFPFVEPGLEFMIEKPKSIGGKTGEWLEMLGCGMIHPNVLKKAGIDSDKYRGFAWGGGFERLVMLKYGVQDLRYFEGAKLDFLRSFK